MSAPYSNDCSQTALLLCASVLIWTQPVCTAMMGYYSLSLMVLIMQHTEVVCQYLLVSITTTAVMSLSVIPPPSTELQLSTICQTHHCFAAVAAADDFV